MVKLIYSDIFNLAHLHFVIIVPSSSIKIMDDIFFTLHFNKIIYIYIKNFKEKNFIHRIINISIFFIVNCF